MTKKPVSEKRRDAARSNGSKSKGPKSELGKRKSSQNAFRHGLLAVRLAPRPESRYYPVFKRVLKSLLAEFEPKTSVDVLSVETLAAEYVQLARAIDMVETHLAPTVSPKTFLAVKKYRKARRLSGLLNKAYEYLSEPSSVVFRSGDAKAVASAVAIAAKDFIREGLASISFKAGHDAYVSASKIVPECPDLESVPPPTAVVSNETDGQPTENGVESDDEKNDEIEERLEKLAISAARAAIEHFVDEEEIDPILRQGEKYFPDYSFQDDIDEERDDENISFYRKYEKDLNRLQDEEGIFKVFYGHSKMTPTNCQRWAAVVHKALENQRGIRDQGHKAAQEVENHERQRVASMMNDKDAFQTLFLMRRYITSIEGAIDRSRRALAATRGTVHEGTDATGIALRSRGHALGLQ